MQPKLVVALLALGMLTGIFLVSPTAKGNAQVVLDPPKYHPVYYVPGEQLQFTLTIGLPDPQKYDVLVVWDDGNPANRKNWSGNQFNDVTLTSTLVLTFGILPLTAAPPMKDGDWYWVEVHDDQWIETNGTGIGRITWDSAQFMIRTWTLNIEYDRSAYLPGDAVNITWSANLIKDGSLAPSGYDGQLFVNDTFGQPLINPNPHVFTTPSGTLPFRLNNLIPTNRFIDARAWYSSTRSNADRSSFDEVFGAIDGLRLIVNIASASYEPGGIVTADISAKVTDFPPNSFDPGAAGVTITITTTNQRTSTVEPDYGTTGLKTDIHGNIRFTFPLHASIQDGTPFLLRADGIFENGPTATASDTFVVSSSAGMTLVLTFDKSQYLSGDSVTMRIDVSGSTGPFTYISEARDNSGGNLLGRDNTVSSATSNTWTFTIPTTFDGAIIFYGTADDGQGNRRTDTRTFTVLLGILVVNLDRNEYDAGSTITATYALTRNSQVLVNPTYYYEVFDTSRFPSTLVKSGIATGNSVSYQVPNVPASSYMFRITAAEAGRALSGSATASIVAGVLLSISFDRSSYNPGETMRITYQLTPRGRTRLPSSFVFMVGMPGAPTKIVQTTASSGELSYTVPVGANSGQVFITVQEVQTGAFTFEGVTVGQVNPLWTDVGGVPAIVVVLGLFVILAFIMIILMWRRMMPGMAPRAPSEKPPMERAPPPMTAMPGPAPMSVTCKACGAPIEITTSKRPIEVMCPNCGETQMVQ